MDILTRLFGSTTKVKILKLFVFNPGRVFDIAHIVTHTKESQAHVRSEVAALEKMDLIRRRAMRSKTKNGSVRKGNGFTLNPDFEYLAALEDFLTKVNHVNPKEIIKKFSKTGVIRLIVLAGIFIGNPESRIDLLIVGDHLKKNAVLNAVRVIESEIGREIHFAYFETPDFRYRVGLYDKLLRDLLEYPHEKILNKLGI